MAEENGVGLISSGVYVKLKGAGRSITEDQVREALGKYGGMTDKTVINVRRAYGIVHFEEDGAAQKLLGEGKLKVDEEKSFDVEALKQGLPSGGEKKAPKKKTKSKKGSGNNKENGASGSNNKKEDEARDRSLYVSGLGEEFDKEELRKFFETFGAVQSLSVRKKKSKPKNGTETVSCHAFVTFEDASTANATLEKSSETNGLQWSSMTLTIQPRKEPAGKKSGNAATKKAAAPKKASAPKAKKEPPVKKTIYVSNLKLDVTEEKLKELFAKYGEIKGVSIRQRDAFASVEYSSEEEAKKAQTEAKETPITLNGNTLTVSPFKSGRKVNQKQKCAVHLSGFQDKAPSEEELTELFKGFGEIKSFNIRPKRTYGFVEFNEPGSANAVLEEAKSGELEKHVSAADDAKLVVELSDSSRSRQPRRPRRSNNAAAAAAKKE